MTKLRHRLYNCIVFDRKASDINTPEFSLRFLLNDIIMLIIWFGERVFTPCFRICLVLIYMKHDYNAT